MAAVVVDQVEGRVIVAIRNGETMVELPPIWLRERSPDAGSVDAASGQRLFNPHGLPVDLQVVAASLDADGQLTVTFSDGHTTTFEQGAVLNGIELDAGLPPPVHWRAEIGAPPIHDWRSFADGDAEQKALGDFLTFGAIVIDNVATSTGSILDVVARFGFVRETNFGAVFDVRSVPNSSDLAYRAVPLGPHSDNPYRVPVPGIQLLHCLVNETTGGASTLVDGLAVIDELEAIDPDAVRLLATVPLRFRYRDATTDIVSVRPMIDLDHSGRATGLTYSPRLDEMPLMTVEQTRRYHGVRHRMAELLVDRRFEIQLTLQAGQLLMFDNNRVLHGRTGFDPSEGLRHLQGCYIDHDGPAARYRVLARQEHQ